MSGDGRKRKRGTGVAPACVKCGGREGIVVGRRVCAGCRRAKHKAKVADLCAKQLAARVAELEANPKTCRGCGVVMSEVVDGVIVRDTRASRCEGCAKERHKATIHSRWLVDPTDKPDNSSHRKHRMSSLLRRKDVMVVTQFIDRRGVPVCHGDLLEERVEKDENGQWDCRYWVVFMAPCPVEGSVVLLNRACNPEDTMDVSRERLRSRFAVVDNDSGVPAASGAFIKNWRERVAVHPDVWMMYGPPAE